MTTTYEAAALVEVDLEMDFISEARLHAYDMPPVIQRDYLIRALEKLETISLRDRRLAERLLAERPLMSAKLMEQAARLVTQSRDVAEAVAAERERCAEIAQHHPSRFTGAGGWDKQDEGFCAACIDISDTIREGNHEHD